MVDCFRHASAPCRKQTLVVIVQNIECLRLLCVLQPEDCMLHIFMWQTVFCYGATHDVSSDWRSPKPSLSQRANRCLLYEHFWAHASYWNIPLSFRYCAHCAPHTRTNKMPLTQCASYASSQMHIIMKMLVTNLISEYKLNYIVSKS